ncbi:MAG: AroM family protein [Vicinamibacterales bacterium]
MPDPYDLRGRVVSGVTPRLGIITIGQTPRPDLVEAFGAEAPRAEVRVAGALDGAGDAELPALAAPGDYPLLVRLASGRTMEVPRDRLVPRVADAARRLASEGASLVVLACAGDFPDVSCPVPILLPGRIVPAVAGAISVSRRIGVVTPNRAQAPYAARKWQEDGFDPIVTWASPSDDGELARAAAALRDPGIDLVVIDCMGHADDARRAMAAWTGHPVLAAQSVVARVAGALLAGGRQPDS